MQLVLYDLDQPWSGITAILDRKILHLNTELFCLVSQ